jgi:hypothetical protein
VKGIAVSALEVTARLSNQDSAVALAAQLCSSPIPALEKQASSLHHQSDDYNNRPKEKVLQFHLLFPE